MFEAVKEGVVGRLISEEAEPTRIAHIGDNLDGPGEVGVSVPCGGEPVEIGLEELVLRRERTPVRSETAEIGSRGRGPFLVAVLLLYRTIPQCATTSISSGRCLH